MIALRRAYGRGPLHLLAVIVSFAVAAYALWRVFGEISKPSGFLTWLVGAIVAHDLVLLPLYSLAGIVLGRAFGRPGERSALRLAALNHLRVPLLFSGLLLLVWFPLVLREADTTFTHLTGQSNDVYLTRWLILSGVLFAGSALLFAIRASRLARCENRG